MKKCRELWPEDDLVLVCRKGLGDFFLKAGLVDRVFEVQKGQRKTYVEALQGLSKLTIRNLVSPHQSVRTQLFCAQVKAAQKISFDNFLGRFIFRTVQRQDSLPDALRQLALLQDLDADLAQKISDYKNTVQPYNTDARHQLPGTPGWASMSLRESILKDESLWAELEKKFSLQGFRENKTILIFPGSVWATKRWTEEGFAGAGRVLKDQGYQVYVMGGPGEEELSERVAAAIGGVSSLAGKTKIFESAQLIARASLVIGNDSASTHLAAVCETPLVAVFGPTVLEFGYRPWSNQSYVVEEKGLSCRPCGKHGHNKCPIGTHACMKQISAERVTAVAESILP